MDQELERALDAAVREARDREAPLCDRLGFIAERVRALAPADAAGVDRFVARLQAAGAGESAPQVGDAMPGFVLPDDNGRLVSLEQLLQQAPVVVAFLRGHWCPYCRVNAFGLAQIEEAVAPVKIVAISAEAQPYMRQLKAESGAGFPFLSDIGNGYAMSLNLAIWLDDVTAALFGGRDEAVREFQRQEGWILPIPSVFVIGQDGVINARHIDPDYRQRMELDDLVEAAQAALGGKGPA